METPNQFPEKCPKVFPFKVARKNAALTMYRMERKIKGSVYTVFRIPDIKDNVRTFRHFPTYRAARTEGNEMLRLLARNDGDEIVLKADAKLAYCRSVELLRPTGETLENAVRKFVEVLQALKGTNLSPLEAARDCARRNPSTLPDKLAADVVNEFIQTKETGKRSSRYIEDLNYRLGKFGDAFQMSIARIDGMQLRQFLDGLKDAKGNKLSPRSYNNFRGAVISLFEFAKSRKYLPADWNEFAGIDTVKDSGGAIEIFTPDEMAALLTHAESQLVPFLAIGGFAGLRSAEIDRLDWQDVRFQQSCIVVEKNKAKTASRRIVPMSENLKAWLQPHAKTRGKVWPHSHAYLYEVLDATATAAKVDWKQNALRHSFISYRVAETQDVNRVAHEAGNSPAMIFSSYRELVTPDDAKRWFSIKPAEEGEAKIVTLKAPK